MAESSFILNCMRKVLGGGSISFQEAQKLLRTSNIMELADCANIITRTFNGDSIDVETLVNAKSGRCPEDCSFCAQSSFYDTGIKKYPLLSKEELLERAKEAKEAGAASFCLVCAYRDPPVRDFQQICDAIKEIKSKVDIEVKDRKSTRLNSSHANISYAVFCLKKKNRKSTRPTCSHAQRS